MLDKYPKIKEFLNRISFDLQAILDANLLGIYVWGSVTTGAFQEGLSDIDLLVVTKNNASEKEFEGLKMWVESILQHEPMAEILDAVFIEQNALDTGERSSSRGGIEFWKGKIGKTKNSLGDSPIVLDTILKSGIALFGPKPSSVIKPVSRDKILNAVEKELQELKLGAEKHFEDDLKWRYYAVTTLCRLLYILEMESYLPKKEALEWYLQKLDSSKNLVRAALSYIEGSEDVIKNTSKTEYLNFIEEVQKKI